MSKNKTLERKDFMLVKIEEMNKEEILVVSSRDVAEDFGKEHKDILESIRNLTAENSAVKNMFIECEYKNERGRSYPEYLLTRDGFSLLVMGFTGQKALEWKLKYIQAFNMMEKELKRLYEERKQWEIERAKGVMIRHVLTDTIKMKVADSPNKKFMYPNYTKLIYKSIFGKSFNELKEQYGIKGKESLRDYLTGEELKEVEQLEMLVSSLIGLGMGYEEIKTFIEQRYQPTMLSA
jgi:Rha family phage regulatory protein